jgi:hypothetical protein
MARMNWYGPAAGAPIVEGRRPAVQVTLRCAFRSEDLEAAGKAAGDFTGFLRLNWGEDRNLG